MEPALYGADSVGSLFGGDDACGWNVDKLKTVLQHAGVDVPGVSSSMLYCGMWQALFAFHTEDLDLYSINYIHFGRPKSWWFVPPEPQRTRSGAEPTAAEGGGHAGWGSGSGTSEAARATAGVP